MDQPTTNTADQPGQCKAYTLGSVIIYVHIGERGDALTC